MHTGSRLWFCKIIQKATCNKLILAHFLATHERSALENIDQSQRREFLRRDSVSIFKLRSKFKEANKKLIIVKTICAWKYWLKCFRPLKYPSRDTVPLKGVVEALKGANCFDIFKNGKQQCRDLKSQLHDKELCDMFVCCMAWEMVDWHN